MINCPIAVLAHNEERNISRCVESVIKAFEGQDDYRPLLHVVVNGSTDRTADIVRSHAQEDSNVMLTELELGDKCNAWNHYVHEVADDSPVHFFMDGDVTMGRRSGLEMIRALDAAPEANAVAALPAGGRHSTDYREQMREAPQIWGCLYGVRNRFLEEVRKARVRLPVGVVYEDGLLGFLISTDLQPERGVEYPRTVIAEHAFFEYSPLRWYSPTDIRIYSRRRVRYSIGRYQFKLLGPRLKAHGVEALPANIADCYAELSTVKLHGRKRLNSLLFDRLAAREMRKKYQSRRGESSD